MTQLTRDDEEFIRPEESQANADSEVRQLAA